MVCRVSDIFVLDKNERPHHTRMVDAGVSEVGFYFNLIGARAHLPGFLLQKADDFNLQD